MTFVLGFIFGLLFFVILFNSGGDVFKQFAATNIALKDAEEKVEWLEMKVANFEFQDTIRRRK